MDDFIGTAVVPPPLPPKMKNRVSVVHDSSPPAAGATVFIGPAPRDIAIPEVQGSGLASHSQTTGHVVKIKINPENGENISANTVIKLNYEEKCESEQSDSLPVGCIRINVGSNETDQLHQEEMIQRSTSVTETFIKDRTNPYFFYGAFPCAPGMVMSSGQCSPSDTLDSGTCSDLDSTPPPLPKKKSSGITVTVIGAEHKRGGSLTSSGAEGDSDNDSNISCDSLNSSELNPQTENTQKTPTEAPPEPPKIVQESQKSTPPSSPSSSPTPQKSSTLPQGLLKDIRDRSKPESPIVNLEKPIISESTYEERKQEQNKPLTPIIYEADKFYKFHLNENVIEEEKKEIKTKDTNEDEVFAGYKDILDNNGTSTIRSAKGTVRGVRNRVRAGIATFLQINSTTKVRIRFI